MAFNFFSAKRRQLLIPFLLFMCSLTACTYKDRVAPIALPEGAPNMVELAGGVKIAATAFVDREAASRAFGFDARRAGLLPVQVTFQNDSFLPVTVMPEQTFLVDANNNAWPILPREKAYQRTKGQVDVGETLKGAAKPSLLLGAAGAVAGLAVGILSGNDIGEAMGKGAALGAAGGAIAGGASSYSQTGEKIREDLATMSLKNRAIQPQQLAHGVLFFPGTPGQEADSARELRLSLLIGEQPQAVTLRLGN